MYLDGLMRVFQGTRIRLSNLIASIVLVELLILQFRLLSFTLVAVFGLLYSLCPVCRSWRSIKIGCMVLIMSLFLPFDIALGDYHWGIRRGASSGGPHLVLFVVGMPTHARIIQEHGEYISAGCSWPAMSPPKWILVWR